MYRARETDVWGPLLLFWQWGDGLMADKPTHEEFEQVVTEMEKESEKIELRPRRLERYVWALAILWTVVVAASLVWNVVQTKHNTLEAARIHARTAYEKDLVYRRWNAGHGGVYVPVTEMTQPNPYLSNMPERDITMPLGKVLTLMNPAYMTRQVHELAQEQYGVRAHITSLNPIRPENVPDPWETEALRAFGWGEIEVSSVEVMEGEEYIRLMRPLITEKGCLKCHAAQGYQEGDIRGGISVSAPMGALGAMARMHTFTFGLGHVLLWLMGLTGITLGKQRLIRSERERKKAEEALKKYAEQLEQRVTERTDELERRTFDLETINEKLNRKVVEHKRVEEELQESEERFRDISYSMADWIWEVDKTGTYTFASGRVRQILGFDPEELIGKTPFELMPEDEARRIGEVFKRIASEKKPIVDLENWNLTKGGESVCLLTSGVPILDESHELIGYRGVDKDITERTQAEVALRESEDRYRRITEAITDYIYTVTVQDGRPVETFHRPACVAVTGYTAEDFRKNPYLWIQMVHEEDRKTVEEQAERTLSGVKVPGLEHRIVRKDGSIRWVRNTPVLNFDSQGRLLSYDGLLQDITERRQAEEALRKAHHELERFNLQLEERVQERTEELKQKNKQLVEAERLAAFGQMANRVAHELRNPLTAVGGFARRINEQTTADDPNKRYLQMIVDNVITMENKVSEITEIQSL